ncbi:MAG: S-layer homology domain-containing protein, partial [Herbinix sp.]|nr:S-layer homology domain-containing protein [Herbinix sp.]
MKKLFVLTLSAILLAASVPSQSYAASKDTMSVSTTASSNIIKGDTAGNTSEPTDKLLESAITAVKKVITIPESYSEFNYYFNTMISYADSYWNLTWNNPKTYSVIMVSCDLDNHITSYYKYDNSNKNTGIAKYLKSELKTTADDFVKKIAPEVSTALDFIDADYDGIYNGNYIYNYQRINNGVAFPDNNVSVSVNSVTGEVSSAYISWLYDSKVPSANTKITKEAAAKLIKDNMKMKLVYHTDYYNYYSDTSATSKKAFLVYEPTLDYISVDAKSGEVYTTRNEWIDTRYSKTEEAQALMSSYDKASSANILTEEETAKIEELKDLITKSEAIKKITGNKYLYLDKNLTSYDATLQKSYDASSTSSYVWNVTLSDPREVNYETDTDYYRAYAYASVDAKTGKILNFYSSLKSNYDEINQKWNSVKIKYDKAEGRTTLEKFLKTQVEDRFNNSVLATTSDDYIAYYKEKNPVYGGYSYQYNRVNEGIEYPNNYIYGSVDGVTGKIYSFGSYWESNITFESAKGVISADKAMEYYLSKDGFDLKYEINTINKYDSTDVNIADYYDISDASSVEYEIRLVYRQDITPNYISPFTGEQLNYNGEVYSETVSYSYKDIDNSAKNKNILLLADMNIGFEGDNFLPDQYITVSEINDILSNIGYYSETTDTDKNETPITKEQLAQVFIVKLGLEKISKLQKIYDTGYSDDNLINDQYIGAVALAKGLNIMGPDANNDFKPKDKVTRYDAVNMIMNFVEAQQNGIY